MSDGPREDGGRTEGGRRAAAEKAAVHGIGTSLTVFSEAGNHSLVPGYAHTAPAARARVTPTRRVDCLLMTAPSHSLFAPIGRCVQ